MAEELLIARWCDLCLDDNGNKMKAEKVVMLGRVIDLCQRHQAELLPYLDVFVRRSRPEDGKGDPHTHLHQCQDCTKKFQSERGLNHHVRVMHTGLKSMAEIERNASHG